MTLSDETIAELRRLRENAKRLGRLRRPLCTEEAKEIAAYHEVLDKHLPALLAEREARAWNFDMDAAPVGENVLLFCPDRGCQSNRARIEFGMVNNGRGSYHSWAIAWQPLPHHPKPPSASQPGRGRGERERV